MIDLGFSLLLAAVVCAQEGSPTLEQRLSAEDPAILAGDARASGDPSRGALLFHQPGLACSKCHSASGPSAPLGPDLAKIGKDVTDAYLIESVLNPSKVVKKGYESVTIATDSGKVLTGLLAEDRPEAVVLRDPLQDGRLVAIDKARIEERSAKGGSIMPAGLVNTLNGRAQFLDLARYLMEIAEKGPARALELRPTADALAPPPLPDYEKEIDHAGMIVGLDRENLQRGEAIYNRVCVNCHGTKDRPGSLPTALRFSSGTFKNGSDPYSLYRTLSHGFGMMAPQSWMVPKQKYDVAHYIRETFLKPDNPSQYASVDRAYLDRLPRGTSRGPEPSTIEPWSRMDYGPSLTATYEVGGDSSNFAYKGIAVRLDAGAGGVSRGRRWMVFEHDTLNVSAAWSGLGFIDWNGINFNGRHEIHPRIVGKVHFVNPAGPGWANPRTGKFDDPRLKGRDGRPYGPLPRDWSRFLGTYRFGDQVILSYRVGRTDILELPGQEVEADQSAGDDGLVFTRTLNIGASPDDLRMKVAPASASAALVDGGGSDLRLLEEGGFTSLVIPASTKPREVKVLISSGEKDALLACAKRSAPAASLKPMLAGGASQWPEALSTASTRGADDGPFAVDVLAHPESNPWLCQMRLTGFDFLPAGRSAAVCTWDGDVWRVEGLNDTGGRLSWRRIASGLFQPLGLKAVDGRIYVGCRDQIVLLRDLNGDGETDFYENFNSDHQVTEHFHEFAMGLQTDEAGRFYYAKAARHGKTALTPQHGTLLRVARDGSKTDILATGFRAPNGVCVNSDGTFFLTDQEGFWTPKNRINRVKVGGFYGNMWGFHDIVDPSDSAMEQPLCWITNAIDRSPAEMLWADGRAWGPLRGSLLSLSYGYGKLFIVPRETVDGIEQGGVCELPIPKLPTGVMRGRFHPGDGQLYSCGMFAWAGTQEQPGGFYRIRFTGKPVHLPIGLNARRSGMAITFSGPLDRKAATDPANYAVKTWSLKRTASYGSDHLDEKPSIVQGIALSEDGRTVKLDIPGIKPTWSMEIKYALKGAGGEAVDGLIHNTIHRLGD